MTASHFKQTNLFPAAIGKEKEDYKRIIIAPTAYGQALAIVLLSEVLEHENLSVK
ncbi:hypothetical protein [Peribacillus muralis]|uniref:hypothetical protein n=1 Tax=Peribacillus muralis TaxID=264697 RepID=UPI0036704D6A